MKELRTSEAAASTHQQPEFSPRPQHKIAEELPSCDERHASKPPSSVDSGYGMSMTQKPFSDAGSVRSWASVGMGSTDGKKMIVRRVPTSPVELFNIVNPPTINFSTTRRSVKIFLPTSTGSFGFIAV
ncbi:hypothetical protein YQE_12802, partial [Dendroctonus ponderosae]